MENLLGHTAMIHPHRTRVYSKNETHARLCVSTKIKDRPILYLSTVALGHVTFVVHRSGWKRMQENNGVRNVHAWAKGTIVGWGRFPVDSNIPPNISDIREAFYNFRSGHFADTEMPDVPLLTARTVFQIGKRCYYIPSEV